MEDFDRWLNDLASEPLPGGVAAAAVTSAMGAALVVKAMRLTLQKQHARGEDRAALQALLDLARDQQAALLHLAEADERAYRSVLEARSVGDGFPARDTAWHEATEVPIRVAEVCHLLLERLPGMPGLCYPAVEPDLEIGTLLLETGRRAGLLAADANLRARGGDRAEGQRARVGALKQQVRT